MQEPEDSRIHGLLKFIVLKKMNRLGHMRCKTVREETNKVTTFFDKQWNFFLSFQKHDSRSMKNTLSSSHRQSKRLESTT